MADLPKAGLQIDDNAGAFAGGKAYIAVLGCAGINADETPRVFASSASQLTEHDYSQAADYIAIHIDETDLPVIFVGLPIVVAGTVGRQNATGVTGSCAISIAADVNGFVEETDCSIEIVDEGTVGTDQITFNLSCDGGVTTKQIRLGTNNSYTVPYLGIVINFGAGTLNEGDTYTFVTTAPLWDGTGVANAKAALEAQQLPIRSWLVVGDLVDSTHAGYVTTAANEYETESERFVYARVQVRDRLPFAQKSQVPITMTGEPNLTFAASGHTITRSSGSFITDGFAVGMVPTVSGSADNNGTLTAITALSATVMTFASGISNEGPVGGVTLIASEGLVFASSGHTITRSIGNWLNDGFAIGDTPTVSGSADNNGTLPPITALTATVMTFGSGITNETIGSANVTMTSGETMPGWVSDMTTAFASVDAQQRIDIALGRGRKLSPITGWQLRRPAAWAASVREYQHDVQIPCWRKADGPLDGWSLEDTDGNVVEYDERTVGGALAARFTCFRTYANGPIGAFIALSLTRDTEGSILSRTHNMAVTNVACTVTQVETENAIGQVLELNPDGTGTDASLALIEGRVNDALQIALLQSGPNTPEGPRASSAVWSASRTDVLDVPEATLNGVLSLELDGTLEQINTVVSVQNAAG